MMISKKVSNKATLTNKMYYTLNLRFEVLQYLKPKSIGLLELQKDI